MKFPFPTLIALLIFILIVLVQKQETISRGTFLVAYRNEFHIEPKISDDKQFALTTCTHVSVPSANAWVPNHNRSLRAFLSHNITDTTPLILLEQAQPRKCYQISGNTVLQNALRLYWQSETTLGIEVGTTTISSEEFLLDVVTLSSAHHLLSADASVAKQYGADRFAD